MLEKSRNGVEFYNTFRENLKYVTEFNSEEMRIFNLCCKIMDMAYGYNKSSEIKELLNEGRVKEVDSMLCGLIENVQREKEQLLAQGIEEGMAKGVIHGKLEVAANMLSKNLPIELVLSMTGLSPEQIEGIALN